MDARIERLVDQGFEALEELDAVRAEKLATQALADAPGHPGALRLRAEAVMSQDRLGEALKGLDRAVAAHGTDPAVLLAASGFVVDWVLDDHDRVAQALERATKGLRLALERGEEELAGELSGVRAQALSEAGDLRGAAEAWETAHRHLGDEPDILAELGVAQFELLRLDDAKKTLQRAAELDPENPAPPHYLGLVAERRGDRRTAEKHFAQARELSPDEYPRPVQLSDKEFDAAVEDALEQLPEEVRKHLENTAVLVEELPRDEELQGDPPLSPLSLGMFRGPGLRDRGVSDAGQVPANIVLYKRNVERYATSRDDVVREIEQTIFHEVGHWVGWDEEDLFDRGLD